MREAIPADLAVGRLAGVGQDATGRIDHGEVQQVTDGGPLGRKPPEIRGRLAVFGPELGQEVVQSFDLVACQTDGAERPVC